VSEGLTKLLSEGLII